MFGVHREWLDADECKRRDQIANKHGVTFVQIKDPGGGWISWFAGPNLGDPFDRWRAARVREELGVGS